MKERPSLADFGSHGINGALAWGIAGFVGGLNLASLGLALPVDPRLHLVLSAAIPGAIGGAIGIVTGNWLWKRTGGNSVFHPIAFLDAMIRTSLLWFAAGLVYRQTPSGWAMGVALALAATLVPGPRSPRPRRVFAWSASLAAWWIIASLSVQAGIPWRPGDHRPADTGERVPGVLLLTLDTVGARHLGCYGGPGKLTPRIDGLAAEGVVFERALATAPYTLPSLTSMASGLVPSRHGVRGNPWPLPDDIPLFGDHLSLLGIELAAGTDLDIPAGLDRGFDTILRSSPRDLPPLRRLLRQWSGYGEWFDTDDSSIPLTLAARRWLFEKSAEPGWLLWVHYFDDAPHAPYRSPAPYAARFANPEYAGPANGEIEQLLTWTSPDGPGPISDADRQHTLDLYRAELSWLDGQVGVLLDALQRSGAYETSWVIVTADHGEQFGRDGVFQHGKSLRNEVLHVPLIVKPPGTGAQKKGRRIPDLVSGVDIFPTILDIYDLPTPADIDGQSLLPHILSTEPRRIPGPRLVISESPAVSSPRLAPGTEASFAIAASTESGLRLIYAPETGAARFFDLRSDPDEVIDLAPSDLATTRLLRKRTREQLGVASLGDLIPIPSTNSHDPEALQALGYVP